MYIITFFSYQGGGERTRALVNVGFDLARRGRKVLLVDADLEAPTLTALPCLRPEKPLPGLVEYVTEYGEMNQAPPVRDYLFRAAPVGEKGGEVWVMPAGREDADYWIALARIDWQKLYQLHAGFRFFEDTRLQWERDVGPDYVLVHAGDGFNCLTEVCTRQLPDQVVLVASPDGTDRVGLHLVCAAVRAEAQQAIPRKIVVTLVQAGVPDRTGNNKRRLREHGAGIASELGLDDVKPLLLPNDGSVLLEQPVVQSHPRSRAARAYRRLARRCMKANCENDPSGARLFLNELGHADPPWVFDELYGANPPAPRLDRILRKFSDNSEIVLRGAALLFEAHRYGAALQALKDVPDGFPGAVEVRLRHVAYLTQLKLYNQAVDELLRIVATPGVDHSQYMGALNQLRKLSPEKYKEAEIKAKLSGVLWAKDLFKFTDVPLGLFPSSPPSAESFLESHEWQKAIDVLEPLVNDASAFKAMDAFHLAIAYWGKTGKLPADPCKRGVERLREQPKTIGSTADGQLLSLMLWGAGEKKEALQLLDELGNEVSKPSAGIGDEAKLPSFWSNGPVSRDRFQEECHDILLLIKLDLPIKPVFMKREYKI